jgi:tetratricopeptide (TPR) repeat protein
VPLRGPSVPHGEVVIDDEKLQELLTRASSLYNNGEYKGAIEAWNEALSVDPQSQKAREGIRMATLLIGDFDSAPAAVEEAPEPADGAVAEDVPPEEAEARLELGIAHVKQLVAEGRHAEAIEGAQGLLPLASDSPELLALLEQAQHAFESAPFIEEHITLARELLAQERYAEAEGECKKIFTLDASHAGGKQLLKEIRDEIQKSLKAAASQLGGMTVKLSMSDVLKAGPKPKAPAAPAPAPVPSTEEPAATETPETDGGANSFEYGDQAVVQEDIAARAALEAAFADPAHGGVPEESPFELAGGESPAASPEMPLPGPANTIEEPVVEAKTVRPASSRVVPRVPPSTAEPAVPEPAPGPVAPPPVVAGAARRPSTPDPSAHAPSAAKPGAPGAAAKPAPGAATKPAAGAAKPAAGGKPADSHAAIPVADPAAHDETSAWEAELSQLNLKEKERGILRGTGAKAVGGPADPGDVDLMSLLDNGSMPGMGEPGGEKTVVSPPSVPLAHAKEIVRPAKPAEEPKKSRHHAGVPAEAPGEAPAVTPRLRTAERPRPVAARKRGSSFFKILLVLLVLGGGGYAAWVYYIQPRVLGGAGQPGQPVAPPARSPPGTRDAGASGGGGRPPPPARPPGPSMPLKGPSRRRSAAPAASRRPPRGRTAPVSRGLRVGPGPPPLRAPPRPIRPERTRLPRCTRTSRSSPRSCRRSRRKRRAGESPSSPPTAAGWRASENGASHGPS